MKVSEHIKALTEKWQHAIGCLECQEIIGKETLVDHLTTIAGAHFNISRLTEYYQSVNLPVEHLENLTESLNRMAISLYQDYMKVADAIPLDDPSIRKGLRHTLALRGRTTNDLLRPTIQQLMESGN